MVTIGQIAAEIGMSQSTVSRALRGVEGVSPETIEAVRSAADRMGYVANAAASGLATGRRKAVAVVVPSLSRWFYCSALSGVDRALREAGYDTMLVDLDRTSTELTRTFARADLRGRVDAVIAIGTFFSGQELAEFSMLHVPMIAVGPKTPGFRTIGIDDAAAMSVATAHVLELGHRTLGYMGGFDTQSRSLGSAAEREHAFMTSALGAGAVVDPSWMMAGRYRQGIAREVAAPVFSAAVHPTALVCASDEMAIGAMYAIQAAGLRIPEDVSVIGIDGHEYAESFDLTTVVQDPEAQGELAARQVVAEIEGAVPVEAFDPSGFSLVVRGSTAPPPAH